MKEPGISENPSKPGNYRLTGKESINFSLKPILLLHVLFILFYCLFVFFSGAIHQQGVYPDFSNINPWYIEAMSESDGYEFLILTLTMPVYLLLAYLIQNKFIKGDDKPSGQRNVLIYFVVVFLVFMARFIYTGLPLNIDNFFLVLILCSLLTLGIVKLAKKTITKGSSYLVLALFFILLTLAGVLINSRASIFDYSYFIGPANKILQGEMPGSFYMQYNLLGTYLVALMQKLNLQLHQMQLVLILIFSFWILLYRKAALGLFHEKTFAFLFLFALLIIRCFAIIDGPVCIPQVSPLRLDLWVPLLLFVIGFGFNSLAVSLAFSLCYLADDIFGFLYLGLYFLIILLLFLQSYLKNREESTNLKSLLYLLPPIIALLLHFVLFHSLSSSSGKIYSQLHIGFMPISFTSSFWFIACFLPVCLYILNKNQGQKEMLLFIFGIACIQLTYFFGRSHDHNLLNISGIFVFIVFLTLDHLYRISNSNRNIIYAAMIITVGIGLNYNSSIKDKWNLARNKIQNNSFLEPDTIEQDIEHKRAYLKSLEPQKIIFLSDADAYLNYRLGYRQLGFYTPFWANVYADQTADFLKYQVNHGYRLIVYPVVYNKLAPDICSYNMANDKVKFVENKLEYGLIEIKLTEY